ncbi:MAG: fructose-bisphosphatase class II, partial [Leptospiraceae bacterium]|nr:fructose-bisphosphatase class II [Leptospiraceae bacterium]
MEPLLKKELSLSIGKITQSTALKILPLFGKNDKKHADYLAVEAMREGLDSLPFGIKIVLGEGEKDESAHLYEGEVLGRGEILLDLIVDPLECTTN